MYENMWPQLVLEVEKEYDFMVRLWEDEGRTDAWHVVPRGDVDCEHVQTICDKCMGTWEQDHQVSALL